MLTNRIIGAFTFRKGVYAEVEHDESFTQTAWLLVAVVAFLSQLGSNAASGANILLWLLSGIVGAVITIFGFALASWVISWVGKTFFRAEVEFGETVRALGLAYVWNVVGFLGVVAFVGQGLECVLTPVFIIAAILGFIAWLVAAKEALDLDWIGTIVTIIIGIFVYFAVIFTAGIILALLGLTAAGIGGMLFGS